jgi:hypothetical protein
LEIWPHDVYRDLQPVQSQNTPSTLLKPHYHTIDHHRLTPEDNGAILSNATYEKVT